MGKKINKDINILEAFKEFDRLIPVTEEVVKGGARMKGTFLEMIRLRKEIEQLLSFLLKKKSLKLCPVCGRTFKYKERKIYCSPLTEGRDCGKKARNIRSYLHHRQERLRKSIKRMKELRKLYKERNIKK